MVRRDEGGSLCRAGGERRGTTGRAAVVLRERSQLQPRGDEQGGLDGQGREPHVYMDPLAK